MTESEFEPALRQMRHWCRESPAGRARVEDALFMMISEGLAAYLGADLWFDLVCFVYSAHSIEGAA
jgi:hypothetical protein